MQKINNNNKKTSKIRQKIAFCVFFSFNSLINAGICVRLANEKSEYDELKEYKKVSMTWILPAR